MGIKGFTLIEVVIAMAMSAVVALSIGSILTYQFNAAADLRSSVDFSSLKSEVMLFTSASSQVCASLFAGNSVSPNLAAHPNVTLRGPLAGVIAGKIYGSLTVNSIQFTGFKHLGATSIGPNSYSTALQIVTTGFGGPMSKVRTDNFAMIVNIPPGSNAITACNVPGPAVTTGFSGTLAYPNVLPPNNPGASGNVCQSGYQTVGNIGANRQCAAFLTGIHTGNGNTVTNGCWYDAPTGNIYACATQYTECGYICIP